MDHGADHDGNNRRRRGRPLARPIALTAHRSSSRRPIHTVLPWPRPLSAAKTTRSPSAKLSTRCRSPSLADRGDGPSGLSPIVSITTYSDQDRPMSNDPKRIIVTESLCNACSTHNVNVHHEHFPEMRIEGM